MQNVSQCLPLATSSRDGSPGRGINARELQERERAVAAGRDQEVLAPGGRQEALQAVVFGVHRAGSASTKVRLEGLEV